MRRMMFFVLTLFAWATASIEAGPLRPVWMSPENCPIAVFSSGEEVSLLNISSGVITSYELACVRTTSRGLTELPSPKLRKRVHLNPGEAAFSGNVSYRTLRRACLRASAAIAPTHVSFQDGKTWAMGPVRTPPEKE